MVPDVTESSPATHRDLRPSEALSLLPPPLVRSHASAAPGQAEAAAAAQVRYGFRTGGLAFLVQPGVATEVAVPPPIAALPGAPTWLRGMVNLRGTALPVYDVAMYAGLPASPNGKAMLLVFGRGQEAAALVIDDTPQRLICHAADKVSPPALPDSLQPLILGASLVAETLWLDFDHRRAFGLLAGCGED